MSSVLVATMTLAGYMGLALEFSPEVRAARASLDAAAARHRSAAGQLYLPSLSAEAQTNPWGYDPLWGGRFHSWRLRSSDTAYAAGATWNVFDSFFGWRRTRQASFEREAAEAFLQEAAQDRALEAARSFLDLFVAQKLMGVAEGDVQAQRAQYELTRDLYKNGMKSRSDLLKSETDWRSSQIRLLDARAESRRALFHFNVLVERAPESAAQLAEPGPVPAAGGSVGEALRRRPELRRTQLELDAARSRSGERLQGLLPRLSADARFSTRRDPTFGDPALGSGRSRPNYWLALTLSLPAGFNGWSQAQDWLGARAEVRRLEAGRQALSRRVREEFVFAGIGLEQASESLRIGKERELIARDNLEIVTQQYREGSADVIRLAQARLDYREAQVASARLARDVQLRWLEHRRASGEALWNGP